MFGGVYGVLFLIYFFFTPIWGVFPPPQLRVSKEQEHFLVAPQGLACSEVTAASLVSLPVSPHPRSHAGRVAIREPNHL